MDCRPTGSSVHGILQAKILEWVAMPFSRGSSWPRDWTQVSCIAGRFFTIRATWEAQTVENQDWPLGLVHLVFFNLECFHRLSLSFISGQFLKSALPKEKREREGRKAGRKEGILNTVRTTGRDMQKFCTILHCSPLLLLQFQSELQMPKHYEIKSVLPLCCLWPGHKQEFLEKPRECFMWIYSLIL